ncbi:uncharacterized protein SCHCODRAFT_01312695 [Schizophyllum commune H4-8]|uniref:uncharacterized protein n=1 Tax=Schizophyllum commune (strain H4-8 / FGSC 9210) TaxID=578458 RepID=UPI00215EEF3E|nr:uncharacterized protein SCHCODRAFT_01312695 [Schizophyllum commune H4-8]KAI5891743.1 hypothetical protein SCHCODRAFT_01312695 [Schizophyllum commune H4-8]
MAPLTDQEIYKKVTKNPQGDRPDADYYGDVLYHVYVSQVLNAKDEKLVKGPQHFRELLFQDPTQLDVVVAAHARQDYTDIRDDVLHLSRRIIAPNVSDTPIHITPSQPPLPSKAEAFNNAIKAFLDTIRESIEKLARGEVGSPDWHPPECTPSTYVPFLEDLHLPCTTEHPHSPSLLLHQLGDLTEQTEARECLNMIFRKQVTYLCNVAGAGKTRLLLEGLTLHWGFFFTLHKTSWGVGSNDWTHALSFIEHESDFSVTIPPPRGSADKDDTYRNRLHSNQAIVRRRVLAVLLARLLVFRLFVDHLPPNLTSKEESTYRKRWVSLQVDPGLLPSHYKRDIFYELTDLILEHIPDASSTATLLHPRVKEAIAAVLPVRPGQPATGPMGDRDFYFIVDEAQYAAHDLKDAFRAGTKSNTSGNTQSEPEHRPLLRQILHALLDDCRSRPVHAIPTGTSISQADFLNAIKSAFGQALPQKTARYTGGIHTQQDVQAFAGRVLPPSYLSTTSGQRLVERMFKWLPGRFRLMARFLTYVLQNGLRSPHQLLNSFVFAYTAGYEPTDGADMTEMEEEKIPLALVKQGGDEQIDFDSIDHDESIRKTVSNTVRPLVFNYIMKSIKKTIVSEAYSPLLVQLGFAHYDTPDDSSVKLGGPQEATIDEPVIILRLATWLNGKADYSAYHYYAKHLKLNEADGSNNGWENYMAHCLIRLFSENPSVPLRDIFDPLRTAARNKFPGLMNQTAQIVRVYRSGKTVRPYCMWGDVRDNYAPHVTHAQHESIHPRVPDLCLGDTPHTEGKDSPDEAALKKKYEQTISWLKSNSTAIFFPDTNFGPDLMFVLRLQDGTFCWLAVQCKLVTPTTTMCKVPPEAVQSALHSVTPQNFFLSKNRKVPVEYERQRNKDALDALKELPHRTSLAGEFSCIRAVALFPGKVKLEKKARQDRDSHPLVAVNFARLKHAVSGLEPRLVLEEHEQAKFKEARANVDIATAAKQKEGQKEKTESKFAAMAVQQAVGKVLGKPSSPVHRPRSRNNLALSDAGPPGPLHRLYRAHDDFEPSWSAHAPLRPHFDPSALPALDELVPDDATVASGPPPTESEYTSGSHASTSYPPSTVFSHGQYASGAASAPNLSSDGSGGAALTRDHLEQLQQSMNSDSALHTTRSAMLPPPPPTRQRSSASSSTKRSAAASDDADTVSSLSTVTKKRRHR